MPQFIQPSFAKGELSPALYGRVDTAAYQVGLKTARNVIVHAYGGASNRPGTQFIGPVKNHAHTPRLIDFQFKATDTYILEFGDEYMRVIRDDGHVLEAPQNITGITMANPAVVTITGHGYSNGDEIYISGVEGMTEVNGKRFAVANATTDTFQLVSQVTGVGIDSSSFTEYSSGGTAERVYTLKTPYSVADLFELKTAQSADVMTITHPNYPIYELSRTDHASWSLDEASFAPDVDFPTALSTTANTTGSVTVRYRVTAVKKETGEESLPGIAAGKTITGITKANPAVVTSTGHGLSNGDEVYLSVAGMTELNGRRFIIESVSANTFALAGEDSTSYTTFTSGTAYPTFSRITNGAATANNTISWTASDEAQKYVIYKESNGIFGLIGESETTSFTDNNIQADTSVSHPRARNPFLGAGNYPGCTGYYEQRRVFGGSLNNPDTSYYSKVGFHSNFTVSSPIQDDDAITARLNSGQVNEIRHFVPLNDLLLFTSGNEWQINSGPESAFSPSTIKHKPQTNWGCAHLAPIVVGGTVLFVQDNNIQVRSFGYSLQIDGYSSTDLTLLASHLFKDTATIVDWAFVRSPDPIIYVVRSDGQMATLTFNQEQEVVAWTHWDTDGDFEAIASVRPSASEIDQLPYVVVKRVIDGNTVRYIERLHTRRFDDIRDAFFVDSGLSYDFPVTITDIDTDGPLVITAPAHGFSNGDIVDFSDIEWEPDVDEYDNEKQPDQLNNRRYTVAGADTDTFQLTLNGTEVNGSDFNAYVSGGKVRKTVMTISGLDHLEGKRVVALSDGNVVSNLTVTNGAVTLPRRASRIHIGLKYVADIETLNVEAPSGTVQGRMKKIAKVTVRFEKSRGLFIGHDSDSLTEMKQRRFEAYDEPTRLLTGDEEIILKSSWNTNGRIFIRQRYPLPMTILAIIPDLNIE